MSTDTDIPLQLEVCRDRAIAQLDRLIDEIERLRQDNKRLEFAARLNMQTIASMVEQHQKDLQNVAAASANAMRRKIEGEIGAKKEADEESDRIAFAEGRN